MVSFQTTAIKAEVICLGKHAKSSRYVENPWIVRFVLIALHNPETTRKTASHSKEGVVPLNEKFCVKINKRKDFDYYYLAKQ